ncbi:MAG TPA: hypothetical protein VJQ47_00945 [Steroidobacteraceae bacterium]|nr:hypothetical protein [Steroidobacteraceae bacterium]
MDGYAVARALRRALMSPFYLVAHTARNDLDQAAVRTAGFDLYVRKPMDESSLQDILRERQGESF